MLSTGVRPYRWPRGTRVSPIVRVNVFSRVTVNTVRKTIPRFQVGFAVSLLIIIVILVRAQAQEDQLLANSGWLTSTTKHTGKPSLWPGWIYSITLRFYNRALRHKYLCGVIPHLLLKLVVIYFCSHSYNWKLIFPLHILICGFVQMAQWFRWLE